MTSYIYVWVRTDISLAQQVVQACHASVLAGRDFRHRDDTHLILLQVEGEEDLVKVGSLLVKEKIEFRSFYEPDPILDEPMCYTAIATEMIEDSRRSLFYNYNLWSGPDERDNLRSSREITDVSGSDLGLLGL